MSEFKDYYETLEVSREASSEEIRQAYRKLAFDFHPDRNPTDEAHRRFLLIGEAYQVLNDSQKRQAYNSRYDRVKGLRKSPSASGASLEMVRRKRASRYNRTGYAQRVRYRGSASTGSTQTYDREPTSRTRQGRAATKPSFSEAYAEQIIEEERSAQIGFSYYAATLRAVAGILLLLCLGMVIDKALATRSAPETIRSKSDVHWSLTAPGVVRFYTSLSHFSLKTHYADLFQPGHKVDLIKSPFAKVPVRALLIRGKQTIRLQVFETRYTGPFPSVWLLIISCLATLFFRRNPEFGAYLGTFTMILALIVLGVIFS